MSDNCPNCGDYVTGSKCTNCGFILYDEHQCANCGYYDTEEETKWDTEVEKSYKFSNLEFVLRVIMIGGVGLIFSLLLFWVISGLGYLASIWSGKGFYIPLILCFIPQREHPACKGGDESRLPRPLCYTKNTCKFVSLIILYTMRSTT